MSPISIPTDLFPGRFAAERSTVLVDPPLPGDFTFITREVAAVETSARAVVVHLGTRSARPLYREHQVHLRIAEAGDAPDQDLLALVRRFGPLQARSAPALMVLARDDPDFPKVA